MMHNEAANTHEAATGPRRDASCATTSATAATNVIGTAD
jgi:hypothetical protein